MSSHSESSSTDSKASATTSGSPELTVRSYLTCAGIVVVTLLAVSGIVSGMVFAMVHLDERFIEKNKKEDKPDQEPVVRAFDASQVKPDRARDWHDALKDGMNWTYLMTEIRDYDPAKWARIVEIHENNLEKLREVAASISDQQLADLIGKILDEKEAHLVLANHVQDDGLDEVENRIETLVKQLDEFATKQDTRSWIIAEKPTRGSYRGKTKLEIVIRKPDGTDAVIPIEKLHPDDRDFLERTGILK